MSGPAPRPSATWPTGPSSTRIASTIGLTVPSSSLSRRKPSLSKRGSKPPSSGESSPTRCAHLGVGSGRGAGDQQQSFFWWRSNCNLQRHLPPTSDNPSVTNSVQHSRQVRSAPHRRRFIQGRRGGWTIRRILIGTEVVGTALSFADPDCRESEVRSSSRLICSFLARWERIACQWPTTLTDPTFW